MTEPKNGAPPPIQFLPTGGAILTIDCLNCNKKMPAKAPPYRLFNGPDCSVIVFPHENLDVCPNCGTSYLVLVNNFNAEGQLTFKWVRVKMKEQSSIAPGTEEEMKKALEAAGLVDAMKMPGRKQ